MDYSNCDYTLRLNYRRAMKSLHQKQYRQIIARLVAERERLGISHAEIATRLTTTQSAVSKIERCERRLDVGEFFKWCKALAILASDIVSDFEPRPRRRTK